MDILQGHSKATMLLICNNAAQGILSSFFFKYAGDYGTRIFFVLQLMFLWIAIQFFSIVLPFFSSSQLFRQNGWNYLSLSLSLTHTHLHKRTLVEFSHGTSQFILSLLVLEFNMHFFFSKMNALKDTRSHNPITQEHTGEKPNQLEFWQTPSLIYELETFNLDLCLSKL